MSISNLLKVAALLGLMSSSTMAATYSTTLDYSGLNTYVEQAGGTVFGTDIIVGDTVSVTHQLAATNDYWSLSGTSLWAPVVVDEFGTRTGDTSLSFYKDGFLVGSGSTLNSNTNDFHIGDTVSGLVAGLQFDTMVFNYLLGATTSGSNILNTQLLTHWTQGVTYTSGVSAVPIPAALFMFAPALLGFMGFRRKAKNVAV